MFALEQWHHYHPRPTRLLLLPPVIREPVGLLPAWTATTPAPGECGCNRGWRVRDGRTMPCPRCDEGWIAMIADDGYLMDARDRLLDQRAIEYQF